MTLQRRGFMLFPHTRFQSRNGDMGLCPGGLVKAAARLGMRTEYAWWHTA